MKIRVMFAATLFAAASYPILAQQPTSASQPATQQNPPATAPAQSNSPAGSQETTAVEMSPVNAELVGKLDSKTAKTGDNVVIQTSASVKTSDGTEIPKGSKLMGHVIAVQASAAGTNSQVALEFDHVELKGGQSLPVHSQIQSISPAEGSALATSATTSANGPAAVDGAAANRPPAAASSSSPSMNGNSGGSRASNVPSSTSSDPSASSPAGAAGNGLPPAGTVVAKNGNIAIQTTSIPGVLLANNAPGQQDPRMARASSILLGAKRDIKLDGGTQMVVGVAAGGGMQ